MGLEAKKVYKSVANKDIQIYSSLNHKEIGRFNTMIAEALELPSDIDEETLTQLLAAQTVFKGHINGTTNADGYWHGETGRCLIAANGVVGARRKELLALFDITVS